ncbi:MAG TPA: hypothetical protein VN661_03160 [Candidatus Acidoferrales bacterium]|nr:hypothetical protein [Candidatus Acidoferrales bacterium]
MRMPFDNMKKGYAAGQRLPRWAAATAAIILGICGACGPAAAQGCVAAHSDQPPMDAMLGNAYESSAGGGPSWLHNLTVTIGYRVFSSNQYFIGTHNIARPMNRRVENHQNIWDVNVNYRITPRWSFIADVPVFQGTRNQVYPPAGVFDVAGIGDVAVGAQAWMFRPPTESGANVAFSASLKIPTGLNDATGTGLLRGQMVTATSDQSLQPGDGGWGLVLGTQAYKQIWLHTMMYFQGQWLFNPRDTNGVATFRSQPGQSVMSVTDQYLFRGGLEHGVPKIHGLALSLGGRLEGVPVRDAFGSSNGFRRPGYILSIDPGLMYSFWHETISVSGPVAMDRDRRPSVPEIQNGTTGGDAFFADYTIIASLTHRF